MFPLGNNSDHLSVYLEVADPKKLPADWYQCVQFSIRMCNPEDETIDLFRGMCGGKCRPKFLNNQRLFPMQRLTTDLIRARTTGDSRI
jgi:hypothetical protein